MKNWHEDSVRYELWARDRFDRDAAPHLDASGEGLIEGLRELWRSVLREGVLDDGAASFTSFDLRGTDGSGTTRSAILNVQPFANHGLARLRGWIYGQPGPGEAESHLVRLPLAPALEHEAVNRLARTHAALLRNADSAPAELKQLLEELAGAQSLEDALERLERRN